MNKIRKYRNMVLMLVDTLIIFCGYFTTSILTQNFSQFLNPKNLDGIDIGGNVQEEYDKPKIDFGGKEEVKEKETNTGNFDNNKGRFQGNNIGFNYSDNDLSLSQSVCLERQFLEEFQQLIDEGFLPVFLKINDFSPIIFFINHPYLQIQSYLFLLEEQYYHFHLFLFYHHY